MATLAVGIAAQLTALVPEQTLVELTRARGTGDTVDTDRLAAAAGDGAADVIAALGSAADDSADARAVSIGARIALARLANVWRVKLSQEQQSFIDSGVNDLERERVRRVAAAVGGPEVVNMAAADAERLARLFPEIPPLSSD